MGLLRDQFEKYVLRASFGSTEIRHIEALFLPYARDLNLMNLDQGVVRQLVQEAAPDAFRHRDLTSVEIDSVTRLLCADVSSWIRPTFVMKAKQDSKALDTGLRALAYRSAERVGMHRNNQIGEFSIPLIDDAVDRVIANRPATQKLPSSALDQAKEFYHGVYNTLDAD